MVYNIFLYYIVILKWVIKGRNFREGSREESIKREKEVFLFVIEG